MRSAVRRARVYLFEFRGLKHALLCRRAGAVVGKQAGQSFSSLREGVQQETEYITKRINNGLGYVQSGPRHVQSVLARLQKRIEETRLQALLEVCAFASLPLYFEYAALPPCQARILVMTSVVESRIALAAYCLHRVHLALAQMLRISVLYGHAGRKGCTSGRPDRTTASRGGTSGAPIPAVVGLD